MKHVNSEIMDNGGIQAGQPGFFSPEGKGVSLLQSNSGPTKPPHSIGTRGLYLKGKVTGIKLTGHFLILPRQ
jgi:hypothetical protein